MKEEIINELTIRVAGESGDGIITVADSICRVAARMGLHLATFRTFPAEIKGGACMMQVRASANPIFHHNDYADLLVALNEEAVSRNQPILRRDGTLIYETGIDIHEREGTRYVAVPFRQIAIDTVGTQGSRNLVVLGVLAQLFSLPQDQILKLLEERFRKRGQVVLENNLKGLHAGIDYAAQHLSDVKLPRLQPTTNPSKLLMTGNEAAALGSIAADVDCYFGYPITPSSEIMEYLAKNLPRLGKKFLQTEDEISAIAGCCGAAWTGKRSMTATSGPGVSLMSEILGLVSMAELPTVIVDSQRGGPSTGLPTKTEQSDLLLSVYGSHGEAPRIVLAPSTVRECLEIMVLAFNLAEKYQMPAIVLLDQALSSRLETVDADILSHVKVIRTVAQADKVSKEYRRFQLTDSGVSPRILPGTPGGFEYMSSGLEHNERGDPQYDERMHTIMSAKRHKKLTALSQDPLVAGLATTFGSEKADIGVICWGSTAGPVREAVNSAMEMGIPVKAMVPKLLNPLVHTELKPFLSSTKKLLVPEMNFTGQLATLLRANYRVPTIRMNAVKGVPFRSQEILEKILQVSGKLAGKPKKGKEEKKVLESVGAERRK